MNQESTPSVANARIEQEAADWLARRERGFSPHEQDEFHHWLASDPRHREWFSRHQQTVFRLRRLAQWLPEHGSRPNPDLLSGSKYRPAVRSRFYQLRYVALATAAAAAAVLLWFAAPPAFLDRTGTPTIARKVLDDGSTIDLRPGAEVVVAYSKSTRLVRLLRGEATFTAARHPDRPFIVDAQGVQVRAVGTAFNVNLQAKGVDVRVTEGRVQVTPTLRLASDTALGEGPASPGRILDAGQQTFVSLDQVAALAVDTIVSAPAARELAGQPRQLEFNETPLAQVVAEFNASNRVKMVIDDPGLAAQPIGASLRSDNIDGFVRLLEASFHVRAERRSDNVIVLQPAD